MIILKVISRLLDYPTAAMFEAENDLVAAVQSSSDISEVRKTRLITFINNLVAGDLYDAQERYDLLFDRGRALSLLLFEHVHGESRDRGQAMVELIKVYRSRGFEIDTSQLPDYIPLYLEFLSEQETDYARQWLIDICHLLVTLSERLIQRECDYSLLFDVLIDISGYDIARQEIAEAVSKESRDDTAEAIDKEWEDKEVLFDNPLAEQCSGDDSISVPLEQVTGTRVSVNNA